MDGCLADPVATLDVGQHLNSYMEETDADWEEMSWLMGQGVGLISTIEPADDTTSSDG